MSITSIGSSFTTTPIQPPPPAQPVEQVAATAKSDADNQDQDQSSNNSGQRSSARVASDTARESRSNSTLGVLLSAQEATASHPSATPHDGAAAYGA